VRARGSHPGQVGWSPSVPPAHVERVAGPKGGLGDDATDVRGHDRCRQSTDDRDQRTTTASRRLPIPTDAVRSR
jgi:hypothetical protein